MQNNIIQWTIRNTTYKLIDFGDGTQGFYNLNTDPYEQTNLINSLDASRSKTELETLVQNMKN